MILTRRRLFATGAALLAAPSIVRASSLMPISVLPGALLEGIGDEHWDAANLIGVWTNAQHFKLGDVIHLDHLSWGPVGPFVVTAVEKDGYRLLKEVEPWS